MANTINLQNLKEKQLKLWLESFDVILTDCDGKLKIVRVAVSKQNEHFEVF